MNKVRGLWSMVSILLVMCSSISAKVVTFNRPPLRFSIEVKTIYDDNIYLYSKEYISDFQNQVRAYRFPINTYDDLITNLNLSLRIPFYLKSYINLYYKQYLYTANTEKSYQIISTTINKPLTKPLNIRFGYLYLPRYLIRYYRNPAGPSTEYIQCTFSEHLFTIGADYTLNKLKLSPFVRYEIDNYKKNFNFYNSKALRFGASATFQVHKYISLDFKGERKLNSAKGPIPDISYNENSVTLCLNTKLPNFEKVGIKIEGVYENRNFITDNSFETDPFHKSRVDTKYSLSFEGTYRFSKNVQIGAEYKREARKVTTPFSIDIEEIKNYNNNRIALSMKFNPAFIADKE